MFTLGYTTLSYHCFLLVWNLSTNSFLTWPNKQLTQSNRNLILCKVIDKILFLTFISYLTLIFYSRALLIFPCRRLSTSSYKNWTLSIWRWGSYTQLNRKMVIRASGWWWSWSWSWFCVCEREWGDGEWIRYPCLNRFILGPTKPGILSY